MSTRQAGYKTDIARLADDMAKRETRLVVTVTGLVIVAFTILGLLILV